MVKNTKLNSIKRGLRESIQIIGLAVIIALLLNRFIIANSEVPSGSMEPTIMTGSRIIGSRLSYYFSDIQRGDVAIFIYGFRCPKCKEIVEGEKQESCPFCSSMITGKAETIYYVKRVIGMPGDVIDIYNNSVYINNSNEPLEEPYLAEPMNKNETCHFEIPENSYFMMGDNRNYSDDARYWQTHYIDQSKIIAKVVVEYFPQVKIIR